MIMIYLLISDDNECIIGNHDCSPNASCTNTDGSFLCACVMNYTGNGTFCRGETCKCVLVCTRGCVWCWWMVSGSDGMRSERGVSSLSTDFLLVHIVWLEMTIFQPTHLLIYHQYSLLPNIISEMRYWSLAYSRCNLQLPLTENYQSLIHPLPLSPLSPLSLLPLTTFTYPSSLSTAITCENRTNPVNGSVVVQSHLAFGVAEYSCDIGYSLAGNKSLYCTLNETWSAASPSCPGKVLLTQVVLKWWFYLQEQYQANSQEQVKYMHWKFTLVTCCGMLSLISAHKFTNLGLMSFQITCKIELWILFCLHHSYPYLTLH